jgi:hypothetical protein
MTFASLGNAIHFIGDFSITVSNLIVNSYISSPYSLPE